MILPVTGNDLGVLDGPVMAFGGPYGNLQATDALRREAERRGLSPDQVLCTGDLVAYCGDPAATVKAVRDWGIHVVQGNCESALAENADDCGCGFDQGSACDMLSRQWYQYACEHVTAGNRRWMGTLPFRLTFKLNEIRLCAIHGGVHNQSRFIFTSTDATEKSSELELSGSDIIIAGHCGIPFTERVKGGVWHNAGVIGVPANDGTTSVWYSLLCPDGEGVRISHHRLEYDFHAAARRIREVGLAEGYARALETGLWPSLDMLPPQERNSTGRALSPGGLSFSQPYTAIENGNG